MTEDEAKTKWCPMVKYDLGRAVNRDACYDNAGTHCIGSACMMWQSRSKFNPIIGDDGMPTINVTVTYDYYCGLAGKP